LGEALLGRLEALDESPGRKGGPVRYISSIKIIQAILYKLYIVVMIIW